MDTKTAIRTTLDTANMICTSYLGDLTDEEMMHRPTPGCNHIKWQLGHLIASEHGMISNVTLAQCLTYRMDSRRGTPRKRQSPTMLRRSTARMI